MKRKYLAALPMVLMSGLAAKCAPAPAPPSFSYTMTVGEDHARFSVCDGPILWQFDSATPMTDNDRMAWSYAMDDINAILGFDLRWVGESPERMPGVRIVVGVKDLPNHTGTSMIYPYATGRIAWANAYVRPNLPWKNKRTATLHEAAHMFGLGHSPDNTQVMFHEDVRRPPQNLQASDIAGLSGLAADQPCLG